MMKFSSQLFLILPLAMGIGVAMAFQTAINAQLREQLHSPLQAALLSFFTLYTTNFTEPLSYQDSAFLKLPKFP